MTLPNALPPRWSPELARRIDAACDAFEAALRAGHQPKAEDHLGDVAGPDRLALLEELLGLERLYGQANGTPQQRDDLLQRFPEAGDVIERILQEPTQATIRTGPTVAPAGPLTIPGYEILRELGRGGNGVVYEARQLALDRIVALKMLHGGGLFDPEALVRLHAEAAAIARLEHPNIVRLYELGHHQGVPYLCLEYVAGGSLSGYLQTHTLSARQAAELVQTLAQALDHAHRAGIIHRDLKPGNILLATEAANSGPAEAQQPAPIEPRLNPRITDFGLARRMGLGDGLTGSHHVAGTPAYMSPEQAAGRTRDAGPPADIWSLGVLLYQCLTGRMPFEGADTAAILQAILHEEPVPPRRLRADVPRDLETICLKCLHKEPARRYASAADLAEDLRRFLSGEPIRARPVGPLERVVKWARRWPTLATLLGVLLLVGLVGFPLVTTLYFRAETARQESDRLRIRAEQQELQLGIARGRELCISGDYETGLSTLLRSLELAEKLGDTDRARAIRISLAEWQATAHHGREPWMKKGPPITALALSPDASLALVVYQTSVQYVEPNTGRPLAGRLESFRDGFNLRTIWSVAIAPDGKTALTGRADGVARLWDLQTYRPRSFSFTHPGKDVWAVAYSPDGRRCATAGGDNVVRLWDTATGKLHLELMHRQPIHAVAFSPDGTQLLTGGNDRVARLWSSDTGKMNDRTYTQADQILRAAYTPDGRRFLLGSRDGRVTVWRPGIGQPEGEPLRHLDEVRSLSLSRDGSVVLVGCKDGTARLWSLRSRRPIGPTLQGDGPVWSVALSGAADYALLGTSTGNLSRWDLGCDASLGAPLHLSLPIRQVQFSGDGRRFLVRTERNSHLWEMTENGPRSLGEIFSGTRQRSAVLFADGQRLLAGSWNRGLEFWQVKDAITRLPNLMDFPPDVGVNHVTVTPEGSTAFLVATNAPSRIQSWALGETASQGRAFTSTSPVEGLAVSGDGRSLAVREANHSARVWDLATGVERLVTPRTEERLGAIALDRDGKRLAVSTSTGRIQIWDPASRAKVSPDIQLSHALLDLAFAPDGQTLAVASEDRAALLIDLATGLPLGPPLLHAAAVTTVAFSPNGSTLLTGDRDGHVQRWRTLREPVAGSPEELRRRLCETTDHGGS